MGRRTNIEWADSTINMAAGCDGCELYNPNNEAKGIKNTCYAAALTKRYKGNKGFPEQFDVPVLFPHRVKEIATWGDLTGKARPLKPWLNGAPRHIFHGDMGDYFTESLPLFWLLEYLDELADMPHVHMMLTKRPNRMAAVFQRYGHVPANFRLGTSITSRGNITRAIALIRQVGQMSNDLFLSVEPLVEDVTGGSLSLDRLLKEDFDFSRMMVIVGGESGPGARPFHIEWAESIRDLCEEHQVAFFMKQTGSNAYRQGARWATVGKGDHLVDLPEDLRIRMMSWADHWHQMAAR